MSELYPKDERNYCLDRAIELLRKRGSYDSEDMLDLDIAALVMWEREKVRAPFRALRDHWLKAESDTQTYLCGDRLRDVLRMPCAACVPEQASEAAPADTVASSGGDEKR